MCCASLLETVTGKPGSDETFTDFHQEIFGISARLFHEVLIAAVLNLYLMKYKVHGDFRFVSSLAEHAGAFGHRCVGSRSCWFLRRGSAGMNLALVLAELRGGQAVVGGHGFISAKQGGDREGPSAIRASPA